jgi:hypothetical protein
MLMPTPCGLALPEWDTRLAFLLWALGALSVWIAAGLAEQPMKRA